MDYYNTAPSYSSCWGSSVSNDYQNEANGDEDTVMTDVGEQVSMSPPALPSTTLTPSRAGRGIFGSSRATSASTSSYRISKRPSASAKDQLGHSRRAAREAFQKVREEKEEADPNKARDGRPDLFDDAYGMPPPSATFSRRPSRSAFSRRPSSLSAATPSRRSSFSRPPPPPRSSSVVSPPPSAPAHSGAAWAAERARNFKKANIDHMVRYGRSLVSRRPSDASHGRDDLRPGVLFSAAHHTPCNDFERNGTDNEIDSDDSYRTSTAFGVVYSKYRKFVAVRAVEYGIICLPLYTHQGTGCEHRRNNHEYMAVRDSRDVDCNEEDSGRSYIIFHMDRQPNMPFLSPKAAILLTSPVFFSYSTSLTLEGRLRPEDMARLQNAFRRVI